MTEDKFLRAITKLEVQQEYTNKNVTELKEELKKITVLLQKLADVNNRVDNLSNRVTSLEVMHKKEVTAIISDVEDMKVDVKKINLWKASTVATFSLLSAIAWFILNKFF